MDRWLLALAVSALFAVGGFWFLLMNARWQAAQFSSHTNHLTLRHGKLFRAYACGLFLVLELIIGAFALFFPPVSNGEIVLLVTFALLVAALGIALLWDAYRFQLDITSQGVTCHSPWRGVRTIPWSDVERVSFSTANLWFAIEPKSGPAFHVLAIVPGVQQFLALTEANLPHEKLVEAEPGYDWVWRKFPPLKNKPALRKSALRVWLLRAARSFLWSSCCSASACFASMGSYWHPARSRSFGKSPSRTWQPAGQPAGRW
ncbi:MAG: PH domain-containing protein [Gemmataceae bacterium]